MIEVIFTEDYSIYKKGDKMKFQKILAMEVMKLGKAKVYKKQNRKK